MGPALLLVAYRSTRTRARTSPSQFFPWTTGAHSFARMRCGSYAVQEAGIAWPLHALCAARPQSFEPEGETGILTWQGHSGGKLILSCAELNVHSSSPCSRASGFGLMKIDESGRVRPFAEKPKGAKLKAMVSARGRFLSDSYQAGGHLRIGAHRISSFCTSEGAFTRSLTLMCSREA